MGWEVWVVLAAAALGLQLITLVIRHEWRDQLGYMALLVADMGALTIAHATQRDASLLGEVAASLALVLLVGPWLAERNERRARARDQLPAALRAAKLRELLAPGRMATRRRRQLTNLVEARSGGAASVLARLARELDGESDPRAAAGLHEESAMVLFLAQRYADGVAEAERHLPVDWSAEHPGFGINLVRAYGELGRLRRAAETLRVLESGVAARDPGALGLLTQARLTLLAFAGRAQDVDRMLATEAGLLLGAPAKELIHVIARDRAAIRNVHSETIATASDGSPDLRNDHSEMFDPALARTLDEVAQRAAEAVRPLSRPRRAAYVTIALIIANVVVAIVATRLHSTPGGELVRAGALFRPAVRAGEWWRAFSAIFLHADAGHLAVNMLGLFIAGRFCEDAFGSLRYFIIYLGAGLAGAAASTFVTVQSGLSVGASGAIMGLLGGAIVVLVLRRGIWPEVWRRTLLWYLVLLGAVQIYIDFQLPVIDNAAHVGGMVGGAVMTLLVAPGGLLGRSLPARALLVAVAAAALVTLGWTAVQVSRTSLLDTFARLPTRSVSVAGEQLRVPTYWEYDEDHDVVADPYLPLQLPPAPTPPDDAELRRVLERIAKSARSP